MAKLNYDFEPQHRPKRPVDQWTRRMRLVVLFFAVAAVTAAIIYAILPKKTQPVVKPPVKPAEQTGTAASENNQQNTAENSGSGNTIAESGDQNSSDSSGNGVSGDTASETADTGKTDVENQNTADSGRPDKGTAVPGDPAPEDDLPQRSGTVDANAEKELENLLAEKNYQALFAKADDFINADKNNFAARAAYGKILSKGCRQLWESGKWQEIGNVYKVVSGDNLSVIAGRNHTTITLLKKSNALKNSNIMVGQRLYVVSGPWKVEISKKARLLTLLRKKNNRYEIFAVFPIGIGRKNSTPVGKFVICHRRFHPEYRDSQGRVFAYGNEKNPLGAVFLALALPNSPKNPHRGYGIHGTADNATVGRSLSNGCVRMHNDDVTMLFHLLPPRTPVEIME